MPLGLRYLSLLTVEEAEVEAAVQSRLRIAHLGSRAAHVLVRFPEKTLAHAYVAEAGPGHWIRRVLSQNLVENLESLVVSSLPHDRPSQQRAGPVIAGRQGERADQRFLGGNEITVGDEVPAFLDIGRSAKVIFAYRADDRDRSSGRQATALGAE